MIYRPSFLNLNPKQTHIARCGHPQLAGKFCRLAITGEAWIETGLKGRL